MSELAANKLWKQSIANYDGPCLQENPKDISPKTDNSVIIYSFVTVSFQNFCWIQMKNI